MAGRRRLVRCLQVRHSLSLRIRPTADRDDCEGILVWHVRKGAYGDVPLDGLNVVALGHFEGNIWAGAKATMGIFLDERGNTEAARGAADDLRRQGRRMAGSVRANRRRSARHRVRAIDFESPVTSRVARIDPGRWKRRPKR